MSGKLARPHYRNLPTHMKVGNFAFSIETINQEASELAGTFGCCNLRKQLITLADNMTPQNLADTFMHELLHAIHWVQGIGAKEDDEEDYTMHGAHGLCQLWQDNPKEMAWWVKPNAMVPA